MAEETLEDNFDHIGIVTLNYDPIVMKAPMERQDDWRDKNVDGRFLSGLY